MNIAFFADAYKPTHSGVAVSVETTANELRARGHRVVVFAPRYKGFVADEPDVVRFPAGHWFRAHDFPVAWPWLARVNYEARLRFGREEFDVVHTHSPFTMGYIGARWAQNTRTPVVFTFHTLYHRYLHYVPLPGPVTRAYIVVRLKLYLEMCDHVVAPSRPVAQIVHRLDPERGVSVVPTGINVQKFSGGDRARVRQKHNIAPDERVLLYVGRLVPEKNLAFLLRSLAPVLKNEPKTRLLLVGGGPMEELLIEQAEKLGITKRVTFTGFIEPSQMADYYAASDIFTFASRTETQGVSIAEALAAGLPCVVVGAMGAAEALRDGDGGFVVPPREVPFREAVVKLLRDDALRLQMAQAGRARAPELSLSHSADRLLELYSDLLARRPRAVADLIV